MTDDNEECTLDIQGGLEMSDGKVSVCLLAIILNLETENTATMSINLTKRKYLLYLTLSLFVEWSGWSHLFLFKCPNIILEVIR